MSRWGELLTDNCNAFGEHMCEHTYSHTLQLFIGILGPPTFLLRRLIVAGCVALHEGKTQHLLSLQVVREHTYSVTCNAMSVFIQVY